MSRRELDEAGITDPQMRAAYEACRALHAHHGRTYYLATRLLPPGSRPFVHALYGFARYADEIVDDLDSALTPQQRAGVTRFWPTSTAGTPRTRSPGRWSTRPDASPSPARTSRTS